MRRRRSCRCQTSDYVAIWKSAGGKCWRREEKQKQVAHVRGKVGKSRRTAFVQSVVAPENRKVGSQKRRASSLVPRWEGKTCALLWCEAEVFKKDQEGTSTSRPEGFWEFIGWKLARHCGTNCMCAKRLESRKGLCFSNLLGLQKVEKYARRSGGRRAFWRDERGKTWTLLRWSRVGSQESRS